MLDGHQVLRTTQAALYDSYSACPAVAAENVESAVFQV
jgi:hypothetical protein